jgi:ribonucleotide reductase class II
MINADTTEEWWQTVARCINGAQKIGAEYTQEEAERLYDLVFNLKCTFGGRMLWQLGTSTVDRFGLASLLACWWVSMRELEDFCFLFEHLMLGGGVGFSVKREDIHELPKIKKGVTITHILSKDADFIVPDSRQGWVELLRKVLNSYFVTGKSFTYSTILVRGLGEPIKGFGGTSSGPQILIEGLESIFTVFRGREGKKLRSVDVLDINNLIGSIVVAGNVRRCLPEYTLVHTDEGLQRIKNIKVGDRVLTVDGYKKVLNNFYQGKQNTIFIKTQDGSFECTPNHKMAVLKNLGGEYEWVEAQNLKAGDRLGTSRNICTGIQTYLPEWKYEKSKHSTTCQDIIVPELDSDMAWFLGIFQADGYTYPNYDNNGFNACVSLVFNENEYSIAERAKQQLERFGLVNVVLKHRKNENSWMVSCQSKQIAWYLDKNLKQANVPLTVPEYILRANHKIRLAFVCGVMDGDGAANNRPVHVVTTVYENFAKEIQALLYSCGIESRLNEGSENTPSRLGWQKLYHVVLITNHSKNQVINCEMLEKDIRISSKTNYSNGYPSSWLVHGKRELGAYSNEQVTIDRYERYSGITPTLCPVEVLEVQMGNSQVETYDIEVEDVHEFFANGYLTHNSAQIAVGDPDDYLFIKAKNWADGKIPNWRDKSNNTINADEYSHISDDVWNNGYVLDKKTGKAKGEAYGFMNLPLCRSVGRLGEEKPDNCDGINPCGEITLADGEPCNLCEIYLNNINDEEELFDCARLLYKTQKAVWTLPALYEKTDKIGKKNRRIGLGVTGVCQSIPKLEWLDECYKKLVQLDKDWSQQRGWPTSIKLTTVKPSGTASLLAGATPGGHPAYSRFYIRRIRIGSSDPLVQVCKDAGYKMEYVVRFDGSEDYSTFAVEFPCQVGDDAILSADMTAIQQLELVNKLQTVWSDNSVSVTIYYSTDELEGIQEWMKENYETKCKTLSFLLHSNHGFKQAPYEEIDEKTYLSLIKRLKPVRLHLNISSEVLDGLECAGGACPLR